MLRMINHLPRIAKLSLFNQPVRHVSSVADLHRFHSQLALEKESLLRRVSEINKDIKTVQAEIGHRGGHEGYTGDDSGTRYQDDGWDNPY